MRFKIHKFPIHYEKLSFFKALRAKRAKRKRTRLGSLFAGGEGDNLILKPGGGGVLDQWLGIGVPLRVSNPDPV